MKPETRQDKLDRLATRICAGEVVFFIGAGFSLDSEGNSTQLLIARLLARLEALTELAIASLETSIAQVARRLRAGLRTTFSLERTPVSGSEFSNLFDNVPPSDTRPSIMAATLSALAQNYYLINDWACSAFESLVDHLSKGPLPPAFLDAVNARENDLLHQFSKDANLSPIDLNWLLALHKHSVDHPGQRERTVAGKALFLDTLGFPDENVMGGKPMDPDLDQVRFTSTRVRTRHHVLACLAAEGLATTVVTTNYDLLLECAFRMGGVLPLHPPPELWTDIETPLAKATRLKMPLNRRYRHFTRIADATQFFTYGDAHEAAVIHKIHGDVDTYRIARRSLDPERFRGVLPTIVFTFREIQNWREDSWSRDYLSTLLRTRTIVFAGYSAADPVIHDTFRTVYEEIAGYRSRVRNTGAPAKPAAHQPGADARAFFADREQTRSFHGLEILRAASRAAGDPSPELTEHPNLLTFYLQKEASFPNVDETFTWIYHLAARELQQQALEAEVSRLAYQLFDKPCPEEEAKAILSSFAELRTRESIEARKYEQGAKPSCCEGVRRRFRRLTNWTTVFHKALMRQYQLAESFHRNQSDAFAIRAAAGYPWYTPFTEHPQWTAWGVILELAIRRLAAVYVGGPKRWYTSTPDLEVAEYTGGPAVVYRAKPRNGSDRRPAVRRLLAIELATVRRLFNWNTPKRLSAALEPKVWELRPETIPWWTVADKRLSADTPAARVLWEAAAFDTVRWKEADPRRLLGGALGE